MKTWLVTVTEQAVVVVHALAIVMVVYGTAEAFVRALPMMVSPKAPPRTREVWLRYARWLVGSLTILLAADILETTIHTSWETIGQLGAIAVIRTFLNYFLSRDIAEIHQRQKHSAADGEPARRRERGQEPVVSHRSR